MKVPRLKPENLMALDVADAGVLKRNVVRLLLKHPLGIKYGDFSGAFHKLHGHHPQLVLHGYNSLKYLLTDMKNVVVLEKNSQTTVVKLANGIHFNQWLDDREGWDSSEEEWDIFEEEMQSLWNEEAEDEAEHPKNLCVSQRWDFRDPHGPPGHVKDHRRPTGARACTPRAMKRTPTSGEGGGGPMQGRSEPCSPAPFLDPGFTVSDSISQKIKWKTCLAAVEVPICCILQDYPKGLDLRMLTETLKKRGLDLERLSQDVGYRDTVHCLLEMPRLRLTLFYGMVPQNCVVQLLSSSPRLPARPFSTGSSVHKPLSSNASGTFPKHLMKTKPAPVEVLELLTNLINTYMMGVTIKELQEFLLRVMGFDLEKFSIAQGYKDTLEFLKHQMPELQVEYSKKRLQCIVKQGQGKRKKQKKYQRCRKKITKSPEESLALLTNLLNADTSGMRVKKLQELLLALAGFDMEKFCIAQGYVDTLGYLEHQMPELNITYCGNRLDCVVKKGQGKKEEEKTFQGSQEKTANRNTSLVIEKAKTKKQKTCQGCQEETTKQKAKRKKQKTCQGSQEETTKRNTSLFLEKAKRKKQKTCQGSQEETTNRTSHTPMVPTQMDRMDHWPGRHSQEKEPTAGPAEDALAEVLALLTKLIKTYTSRLQVKKLETFLQTVEGFDLHMFTIAQGYKDTLEFLEHQMPELNITYYGNRLECFVKKGQRKRKEQKKCQGSQEEMTNTLAEILVFLTNLLQTYTSGLRVKKLRMLVLTVEGFDLQQFTIAQHYKDMLQFLEHEMPELHITYCGNRLECVVKKGEARWKHSMLGKAKRKEQKTCQGSEEETTSTLADVVAFLTNLLKTYTLGLRVRKLPMFFLTLTGFDLQQFTIAQGYKDLLEFLEHEMPELNFKYGSSRLNCVVKQGQRRRKEQKKSQDSQEKMTKKKAKRKKQKTCQGSQEEATKQRQYSQTETAEDAIEILETQSRSNNLLFRGISEDFGRQNLEERFRKLLQDYLKIQGDFLDFDQIFRMNSEVAFKNKLPRDILVCFTHKKTRDAILKKHRESPFKVVEKEVQIFQHLPRSVLKKRKDFDFLRQILRKKEIRYHWKIPFAIDVYLPKGRKVIKTEEQAKLLAKELQAEELKKKSPSKPKQRSSKSSGDTAVVASTLGQNGYI